MSEPVGPSVTQAATRIRGLAGAAAGSGSSSSGGTVVVPNPPPNLATLTTGDVVHATIARLMPDGRLIADTDLGRLVLALSPRPPAGTILELLVTSKNKARLALQVLGGGEFHRQDAARGEPRVSTSPDRSLEPLRAGAILEARISSADNQTSTRKHDPTRLRPPGPGATTASEAGAKGRPVGVRVMSVQPPTASATRPLPPASFVGTVVASHSTGSVVIETPSQAITLSGIAQTEIGTRVVLQLLAAPDQPTPVVPAGRHAAVLTALGGEWPALEKAIEAVKEADHAVARQFLTTVVPQPGPRLTAQIVFFMTALFGGRIKDWFGGSLTRLLEEAGRPGLLETLGEDFARLARIAGESISGEWRVVLLPFLHEGVLQQLKLYLRQRGDGNRTAGRDEGGKRFVLEAELSRLGLVQLDGLLRNNRFDLVIRTTTALPGPMREDIREIFTRAGADANLAGGISFDVSGELAVAPLERLEGHGVGLVV
ncbi:MAG: hypothetical protein ACE5Q3_12285 [Alphaproteobacteria bacterium]